MSGLSLADMRRLGTQSNQSNLGVEKRRDGLLGSLPFKKSRPTTPQAPTNVRPIEGPPQVDQVSPVPADQVPSPSFQRAAHDGKSLVDSVSFDQAEAAKVLNANQLRHLAVGLATGTVAGLAVSTSPLALPVGALSGAAAGYLAGKQAQRPKVLPGKAIALKSRDMPALDERIARALGLLQIPPQKVTVCIDSSSSVSARGSKVSKPGAPQSYVLSIGMAPLNCLSLDQMEVLIAHALAVAEVASQSDGVAADTLASMVALETSIAQRPSLLRLASLDTLKSQLRQAQMSYKNGLDAVLQQADDWVARYAGPRALVDALLAQGLLAAFLADGYQRDMTLAAMVEALRGNRSQAKLDQALRHLAANAYPQLEAVRSGYPVNLLERVSKFDVGCDVPNIPSRAPTWDGLLPKAQSTLEKAFLAPKASKKRRKSKNLARQQRVAKLTEPNAQNQAEAVAVPGDAPRSKKGLFARVFRDNSSKGARLEAMAAAQYPLYEADDLCKADPATGLEAYQALVDANPHWMLARLRLAEVQLEMGHRDCVTNLMMCAEHLPSALPAILERLQAAMPMISPLDQEPVREAIDEMLAYAEIIAQQRGEIEIEVLDQPLLDDKDRQTLKAMFDMTSGLREAWVLSAPCPIMPEVPHHAILGLAPRLTPEATQTMALSLAEHAAIEGTVAVYIENGKPQGELGDVLASHPSFWRAGKR